MANPPKPSHLKVVQGTDRKDRKNKDEPQPDKIAPRCPDHLSTEEKVEWGKQVAELQLMGVLTRADGLALEQLVVMIVEVRELTETIRGSRTQAVTSTQKEVVYRLHPLYPMLQQSRKELRQLWACFGLDPSARTKVHTVPAGNGKNTQEPQRPASAYLTGPGN